VGRMPGILCRVSLILNAILATMGIFVLPAEGQTSGGSASKRTDPPAGWQVKWAGTYEGQDREGKIAPPGFRVLSPPEPDTMELVHSLSQPWALLRRESTSFELEDVSQLCRPQGPLRANSDLNFQLAVSPEKITMIGGQGGGINAGGIRRIYLNRPHWKNPPLTHLGNWVGHWEGDTLVVDGIGFNEKSWLTRDRHRHTEALHMTERWRFVSNDEWLEKTITVDDQFALTAPYTVKWYHKKLPDDTPHPEGVCLDTPEARRAWVKLYKRYERDYEEERKTMGSRVN